MMSKVLLKDHAGYSYHQQPQPSHNSAKSARNTNFMQRPPPYGIQANGIGNDNNMNGQIINDTMVALGIANASMNNALPNNSVNISISGVDINSIHQQAPLNMVMTQHCPDVDNIVQIHRRKMLRRAANRKSAQLSRARKKAHMEDLKQENARLQKVVDILESQPELLFCVTIDGRITYISERTMNFVKSVLPNSFHDHDPIHINQILSDESVSIVLKTVCQLTELENAEHESISSVKEVSFRDTATYQHSIGYLRCSRVIRTVDQMEEQNSVMNNSIDPMTSSDGNGSVHASSTLTVDADTGKSKRGKKQKVSNTSSVISSSNANPGSAPLIDGSAGVAESVKLGVHDNNSSQSLANAIAALSSLSSMRYQEANNRNISQRPPLATYSNNGVIESKTLSSFDDDKSFKKPSGSSDGLESDSETILADGSGVLKRTSSRISSSNDDNGTSTHHEGSFESMMFDNSEPEFVCVIRPAEVSIPMHRKGDVASGLSSATVAAHNLGLPYNMTNNQNVDVNNGNKTVKDINYVKRPGSPNSSLSSSLNSLNSNSVYNGGVSKGNGTSSESNSDENMETYMEK